MALSARILVVGFADLACFIADSMVLWGCFLPMVFALVSLDGGVMQYCSVAVMATRWQLSERSVRHYCAQGRVQGAVLEGKTWLIPEVAVKPVRITKATRAPRGLLEVLQAEQAARVSGGIYHRVQVDLTYNSNHIEGSRLTHEQTRYIFETNTIGVMEGSVSVADIIETSNHFRCIDWVIREAKTPLSEGFIKKLHFMLKVASVDAQKEWFSVGDYKRLPNEVGGRETTPPEAVAGEMRALLEAYKAGGKKSLEALLDFHVAFERIHPFQDGNGRVGRLILFKECLRYGIVPFIITDQLKLFYYRGLQQWPSEREYLLDTCLTAQDHFKSLLAYFKI